MSRHLLLWFSLCLGVLAAYEGAVPEYEFGYNSPGLLELKRRNSDCRQVCEGDSDPELCTIDCIHPSCAQKALAAQGSEPDRANLRLHNEFRKCAQEDFHWEYVKSLGVEL